MFRCMILIVHHRRIKIYHKLMIYSFGKRIQERFLRYLLSRVIDVNQVRHIPFLIEMQVAVKATTKMLLVNLPFVNLWGVEVVMRFMRPFFQERKIDGFRKERSAIYSRQLCDFRGEALLYTVHSSTISRRPVSAFRQGRCLAFSEDAICGCRYNTSTFS